LRIGIVGAGRIGGTLAQKLSSKGHTIKLAASRSPDQLREQADKVGAEAVTPAQAVKDVDVIILSIPLSKNPEIARLLVDVPSDVVLIDTANYYPLRNGRIAEIEEGKPESVWSSEQLGRPVVKAFNAILAPVFVEHGKPHGADGRIAIPVAGDDERAKAVAQELVDATGFDPFDAGSLADSWRQHPGTPAFCTSLTVDELPDALSAADRASAPRNRDEAIASLGPRDSRPSTDELTALCRAFYNRK
jgi:8-hydroxy-5-deazaflavin:NADPH oxidoreductase